MIVRWYYIDVQQQRGMNGRQLHLDPPSEEAQEIIRLKCVLAAQHLKLQSMEAQENSLRDTNYHLVDKNISLHQHLESLSKQYTLRMDSCLSNLRRLAEEVGVSAGLKLRNKSKKREEDEIIQQIRIKVKKGNHANKQAVKGKAMKIITALGVGDGAYVQNYIQEEYQGSNKNVSAGGINNHYNFVFSRQ